MTDTGTHHGVDYLELPVTDIGTAKHFYGSAFGWRFNDYGPTYTGFVDGARGDREAGGFTLVDAVETGGPLPVLYSSNLEATERAVATAGGTIVKATFDFPGGRRFEFRDPFGTLLGVWST